MTKAKKSALGKGISSLIQANSLTSNSYGDESFNRNKGQNVDHNNQLSLIDVDMIQTNKGQPRKIFKESDLHDLSLSIKENGIIQPLIVISSGSKFELVAGERRLRAAKKAGLKRVPVVIKRATEKEKLTMAIIENVQRSDLNCVEEALAYYQLMEDFRLTQEEVAKKIGKDRSTIANFLRVLKLPREVVKQLQEEKLSFGHAKILAAVKDVERVKHFAGLCVENHLSVRELEKLIKKGPKIIKENTNPFFDEKLDSFRCNLEKKTGFHLQIKSKGKAGGAVTLKYSNEAEFNDIYEFLMTK